MSTKMASTIWAISVICFGIIYIASAVAMISSILNNFDLLWIADFVGVVFVFLTLLLSIVFINHPEILYYGKSTRRKVKITQNVWKKLKQFDGSRLDEMEDNIRYALSSEHLLRENSDYQ